MESLQLMSSESTYVSSSEVGIGRGCKDYLKMGKYKNELQECVKDEMLTGFSFKVLNQGSVKIKKAYMEINLADSYVKQQKASYLMVIKINEEEYDPRWVSWESKPKSRFYMAVNIRDQEVENKKISVDITGLVLEWMEGRIPNYGITLEIQEEGVCFVAYADCTECGPRLRMYCDSGQCESTTKETIALQVQVQNRRMQVTENNQEIKFDTICTKVSTKIDYDFQTNEVVIKDKGCYLVQWWTSIDGSGEITEILFALQNQTQTLQCQASAPVFVLSQPTGNAIIQIDKDIERLQLVNKSGAPLQFANLTVQASLVITKI